VLQCVAACCNVLQCVAVCCNVLQCVAVCCMVLQCVAWCCSLLHGVASDLHGCVAVCCSLLQSVAKPLFAIRMSMLQYFRTSLNLSPPHNNLEIVFSRSLRISGRHRFIRKKSLKDPFRLQKRESPTRPSLIGLLEDKNKK